jgi:HEPN domain-containing protein
LAESRIPGAYLEDLCYEAQQAAEKAIKGVFIYRGERFPFIHDLEKLLGMLERNGLKVPKYVRQAKNLSRFAVVTRYPSEESVVTQREYRRAIRIATAVLRWAERQVAAGAKKPGGTK